MAKAEIASSVIQYGTEALKQYSKSTITASTTTKDIIPHAWELGSISGADGTETAISTRIRTNIHIFLKAGTVVTLSDLANYSFSLTFYNSSLAFTSQLAYQTASYTVLTDTYARMVVKKNDDADLTSLIDETSALVSITLESANLTGLTPLRNKYIHFSVDDANSFLKDINTNKNTYTTIFDNSTLSALKALHEQYGLVVSFYTYFNYNSFKLTEMTDKFASEFRENSNWLKFGFHGNLETTDYSVVSEKDAEDDYYQIINELLRFTGGIESIDRVIRGHLYRLTSNNAIKWRNAYCGIKGLLARDKTTSSQYYLSNDQINYLDNHARLYDATNDIHFWHTSIRFDDYANINTELVSRYNNPKYCSQMSDLIVFTHDWISWATTLTKIEQLCQFAEEYGYIWEYPMNRL
jgi:hypothetical protein